MPRAFAAIKNLSAPNDIKGKIKESQISDYPPSVANRGKWLVFLQELRSLVGCYYPHHPAFRMPELSKINTFPIKGLRGYELAAATLVKAGGIGGDRKLAIATDSDFDESAWSSSRSFLINAVNDGLLKLNVIWDGSTVSLSKPNGQSISLNIEDPADLALFNSRLPEWLSDIVPNIANPKLVKRPTNTTPPGMWDFRDSELSIINLASVDNLSSAIGNDLDPNRFRGNLVMSGMPAWSEFGLIGWRYRLGESELEFLRPMRRCPATEVDPNTGLRNIPVHKQLIQLFGHGFFGVYGRVTKAGEIRPGDQLVRLGHADLNLDEVIENGAAPYALWPKLANVLNKDEVDDQLRLDLASASPWPLAADGQTGGLRLHIGAGKTVAATIIDRNDEMLSVLIAPKQRQSISSAISLKSVIVTGPFGR